MSTPRLKVPSRNVIDRAYRDSKGNSMSIKVATDGGQLTCLFHNVSACVCIDTVISEGWDADLITDEDKEIIIEITSPDIFPTSASLSVFLNETKGPGGGRRAHCLLYYNPITGKVEPNALSLGYLMPGDGRLSLIESFQVSCQDFLFVLTRSIKSKTLSDACHSLNHNYEHGKLMILRLTNPTTSSAVNEAAFLLIDGKCSSCHTQTPDLTSDVPTV